MIFSLIQATGLADDLPKQSLETVWDMEKSSPAFSMPYVINRGCPIGEITGSLAFALCGGGD